MILLPAMEPCLYLWKNPLPLDLLLGIGQFIVREVVPLVQCYTAFKFFMP